MTLTPIIKRFIDSNCVGMATPFEFTDDMFTEALDLIVDINTNIRMNYKRSRKEYLLLISRFPEGITILWNQYPPPTLQQFVRRLNINF
jgi:hypothetical protein